MRVASVASPYMYVPPVTRVAVGDFSVSAVASTRSAAAIAWDDLPQPMQLARYDRRAAEVGAIENRIPEEAAGRRLSVVA